MKRGWVYRHTFTDGTSFWVGSIHWLSDGENGFYRRYSTFEDAITEIDRMVRA